MRQAYRQGVLCLQEIVGVMIRTPGYTIMAIGCPIPIVTAKWSHERKTFTLQVAWGWNKKWTLGVAARKYEVWLFLGPFTITANLIRRVYRGWWSDNTVRDGAYEVVREMYEKKEE